MIKRITFAAVIALVFGTVLVQNTIASTSTNSARVWLAVDGVVDQLRDQGDLVDLIKKLIASGDVCAVAGHKWLTIPNVQLNFRPDGNYQSHRTCVLCGKIETKDPGEWK
jgi:hypothetical protein